jgi:hypothetical protein
MNICSWNEDTVSGWKIKRYRSQPLSSDGGKQSQQQHIQHGTFTGPSAANSAAGDWTMPRLKGQADEDDRVERLFG